MVSMCCEDCRTEKLKSNVFNEILLDEHCKNISEYLGCDDCCKMNAIFNDPIYKTLNPEQQQVFKLAKLFPFPETFNDFVIHYNTWRGLINIGYDRYICRLTQTNYNKLKDIYDHMYIQDYYKSKYEDDDFGFGRLRYAWSSFGIIMCLLLEYIKKPLQRTTIFGDLTNDDIEDIEETIKFLTGIYKHESDSD